MLQLAYEMSDEDARWVDNTLAKLIERFGAERDRIGGKIPYIAEDGTYKKDMAATPEDLIWWTNGFWPGILWQCYGATQDEKFLQAARLAALVARQAIVGDSGKQPHEAHVMMESGVAIEGSVEFVLDLAGRLQELLILRSAITLP